MLTCPQCSGYVQPMTCCAECSTCGYAAPIAKFEVTI